MICNNLTAISLLETYYIYILSIDKLSFLIQHLNIGNAHSYIFNDKSTDMSFYFDKQFNIANCAKVVFKCF